MMTMVAEMTSQLSGTPPSARVDAKAASMTLKEYAPMTLRRHRAIGAVEQTRQRRGDRNVVEYKPGMRTPSRRLRPAPAGSSMPVAEMTLKDDGRTADFPTTLEPHSLAQGAPIWEL